MRLTRVSLLILLLLPFPVYSQDSNGIVGRSGTRIGPKFQNPPKVIQGPVVVAAGYDWAVIEWTTNGAGKNSSNVYAGIAVSDLRKVPQTAEPVTMSDLASYQEQQYTHLVRLNHLQPGTAYYFVVDSGPGPEAGTSHPDRFVTTRRPGQITWGSVISDQ